MKAFNSFLARPSESAALSVLEVRGRCILSCEGLDLVRSTTGGAITICRKVCSRIQGLINAEIGWRASEGGYTEKFDGYQAYVVA